jgi:hypothetical protein
LNRVASGDYPIRRRTKPGFLIPRCLFPDGWKGGPELVPTAFVASPALPRWGENFGLLGFTSA